MSDVLRVVVADDQALVRAGFKMILESRADIRVAAEACDGEEAVSAVRAVRPDVILMDVRMPRLDGLGATRRIVADGACTTHILMLTTFDLDEYVYSALHAGASGFLLKDVSPERLIDAVRGVAAGDVLLAPSITRRLIERYARPEPLPPATRAALGSLTPRELDVLKLIARGLSNAEIADLLILGEATVKTHVARIFAKLGLRDRAHAVVYAYETGTVHAGELSDQS